MAKIEMYQLQKKYSGKIVLLNKSETKVVAVGKTFTEINLQLAKKKRDISDYVIVGPVPRHDTIQIL